MKKQSRALQLAIEDEIERICKSPDSGETKKGDLTGLKVHKFNFQRQEYLLAYKVEGSAILFYMTGTHENFYRKLKHYLREAE